MEGDETDIDSTVDGPEEVLFCSRKEGNMMQRKLMNVMIAGFSAFMSVLLMLALL
jgi:hypothetical protein